MLHWRPHGRCCHTDTRLPLRTAAAWTTTPVWLTREKTLDAALSGIRGRSHATHAPDVNPRRMRVAAIRVRLLVIGKDGYDSWKYRSVTTLLSV